MIRTLASTRVLVGLGVLMLAAGCGDDSAGSGGGGGESSTSGETSAETTAVVTASVASTATSTGSGEGGSGEGGAAVGEWGCLEDPPDAPEYANGPDATIEVTIRSFLVDEGIPDATVRVCEYTDVDCANPVDEAISDADGLVELDVPTGSRHYLEVSGDGLATTLSFPNGPPPDGVAFPFAILTLEELDQFIVLIGAEEGDPDRGHIGLSSADCLGLPAPGVEVTIDTTDEESFLAYFAESGFPDADLDATTTDGRGGVANVPVGEATLTGTVAATDEEISTRTVLVRAGAVSYADGITPRPPAIE